MTANVPPPGPKPPCVTSTRSMPATRASWPKCGSKHPQEGPSPSWEADAERVRGLLRQHLPSAFPAAVDPPPLTVGDVAARLRSDSTLWARFNEVDRAANSRLLADTTLIPEELGLPHFEKWQTTLGVSAGASYWRAFRQAAVLLAMGRCQQAGELAAARRAGRAPKGGRS
jgi:hypothetical protein